jgi:hypothetical protein
MEKEVTVEEFLAAFDIVERYMASVREERKRLQKMLSVERFIRTMEPSKRLCTALDNYWIKWRVNPFLEEVSNKKLARTRGFGPLTKAEYLRLRERFMAMAKEEATTPATLPPPVATPRGK